MTRKPATTDQDDQGGTTGNLADLTHDLANRRRHGSRNVSMLTESFKQNGAARSIVVDEDGVILAGNNAVEAAAEAGITKVQIVETDGTTLVAVRRRGLTPDQKRAIAIYDNRTAELAEWDVAALTADLKNGEDLSAFFFDGELAALGVVGDAVEDPQREWSGMPEFSQKTVGAFHSIQIHFKDAAALEAFGQLIGQPVGKTVRYLWIPEQADEVFKDQAYK